MDVNTVNPKDLAVLSELNLLDIAGISESDKGKKEKFLQDFEKLTWTLFFETDGKDLSDKELEILEKFIKQKDFKGAVKYLKEKFSDIQLLLMKNVLLAKKYIILKAVVSGELKVGNSKEDTDAKDKLDKLKNLAKEDKWQEFVKLFKSFK